MTPHVYWTLRAIARRLGVADEETVLAYAAREVDPLRLRRWREKYWIKTDRLDAWKARQQSCNACAKMVGLEKIAARLGKSVNTIKAFARLEHDPLPVSGLGTPRPWIYLDALVDWYDAQDRPVDPVELMARVKKHGVLASV